MFGSEFSHFPLWWIFPLIMIIFCLFMMGRMGMGSMMCGRGTHHEGEDKKETSESAMEILDRRYARGEIEREEYEEKKKDLTRS
jgi:putative membrane protein